ncbi:hypothetical protein [Polyangium aurulentum]|uniref:hypothetical protein n=1 Tax=Polyangium aurulentum TaxID=2567896 RepID=UPI0010AE18B4|nr:hypothetical protein [Polyangium aurulentum]UQA55564.1 hypothetical protein E8A73_030000 [Polyangium aurulentum]
MHHRIAFQWVFLFTPSLLGAAGCAEVLGIEEWEDPAGGGGAGASDADGGAGSSASGGASGGGTGGNPVNGPTCADGFSNGSETDIDCGGDACKPCDDALKCLDSADCKNSNCSDTGTCLPAGELGCEPRDDTNPTCRDCAQNGIETDVDCGGEETCQLCRVDQGCTMDGDCLSSVCESGRCAAGGPNAACHSGADCKSGTCGPGKCVFGKCCL